MSMICLISRPTWLVKRFHDDSIGMLSVLLRATKGGASCNEISGIQCWLLNISIRNSEEIWTFTHRKATCAAYSSPVSDPPSTVAWTNTMPVVSTKIQLVIEWPHTTVLLDQVQIIMSNCWRTTGIWNNQKFNHLTAWMTTRPIDVNANRSHAECLEIELLMAIKMKLIVNSSISQLSPLFWLTAAPRESNLSPSWVKVSHKATNSVTTWAFECCFPCNIVMSAHRGIFMPSWREIWFLIVWGPFRDETLFAIASPTKVSAMCSGGGFLTVLTQNLRLSPFSVVFLTQ